MKSKVLPALFGASMALACVEPTSPVGGSDGATDTGFEVSDDAGSAVRVCGEPDTIMSYSPDLQGCERVRGSLRVSVAFGLRDLTVLSALREVREVFILTYCLELASLTGLEGLQATGGFGLRNSPEIRSLAPLLVLEKVEGHMDLNNLERLESLRGLESLHQVKGELILVQLPRIQDLAGLSNLRFVGALIVEQNDELRSLSDLPSGLRVGGDLQFKWNPRLPQREIDALLSRIEVGGRIIISGNGP